jgi:hypothetical protein
MANKKIKRNINRRLSRLRSYHRYYVSALDEMKCLLPEYEREWNRDYSKILSLLNDNSVNEKKDKSEKIFSQLEINAHKDSDDDLVKDEIIKYSPDWAKSLYRKIAKETHPDKIKEKDKKDKMKLIFQDASRFIESGEYNKLLDIALSLSIDVEIPPAEMIKKISTRINNLKKEIEKIEKSMPWIWGESLGIKEVRDEIVESIVRKNSKKDLDRDKIEEIIEKIEIDS